MKSQNLVHTPDGSKLLAFSRDQRSCIVYTYKGIGSNRVGDLLNEADVGDAQNYKGVDDNLLKSKIFERLFETKYVLRLCQGDSARYYLHREFSVFLEDGRYVLLAGMVARGSGLKQQDFCGYVYSLPAILWSLADQPGC
ncbi:uncharacterized protein LOC117783767 [Drosophila innubila]|uniref:uncharacterized protein LOC117783767 n=1 Tax=Drosophila innubila TaxID=198719 RepID=UPI00148C2D90|nr:uncharacterized protein LOC117783767 [Drosophila innubila]